MTALHPLVAQAQKKLPTKTSAMEKDFVGKFFTGASPDDLATVDVITLQRTAQRHWDMMQKRKSGTPSITVHSPALETGPGGWPLRRTVIDVVDEDMAFQIDSITAELTRLGHVVHLMIHPVLHVRRNRNGKIDALFSKPDQGTTPQSHIHIQLTRMLTKKECADLQSGLRQIMSDVHAATGDWLKMREKLRLCESSLAHAPSAYADDEIEEYQAFLEYLYKDNFTLLGYREYRYGKDKNGKTAARAVRDSHMGLLRSDVETEIMPEGLDILPPSLARYQKDKVPLRVFKLHRKSTVHRRVPLDAVMVRLFDKKGEASGVAVFIGLFTSVTYSRSIRDIPYLSRKAAIVMDRARFESGTHGRKALAHILEKYPRDELFQIDIDTLYDYAISIMRLQERQRIALYTRVDAFDRNVSCLIYIPRDRYEASLRVRMQAILEEALNGTCQDFYTTLDDSPLARVMISIALKGGRVPTIDRPALEVLLQDAGRAWSEKIAESLREKTDQDSDIARLCAEYGNAFPVSYRDRYGPRQCVHDIFAVEKALSENDIARELYRPGGAPGHVLHLKVFCPDHPVVLSDILPILENMGMRVVSEMPFEVRPQSGRSVWIHDFALEVPEAKGGTPIPVTKINDAFEDALLQVWHGRVENDSLNRLTLTSGLSWREVLVLRTYVRYMRQAQSTYSVPYIEKALTDFPAIARNISALFHARLDPALSRGNADKQAAAILRTIENDLNAVSSLDQDRILRAMVGMVEATLRTNFFQRTEGGDYKPCLSIKLDSAAIDTLPHPRPFREMWAYSPRVEAVHLRGDRIARGGIRWSDRHEDFRTEVLGLMKAQQVKNAVIVPMGAKGGFVVKRPPVGGDRAAMQAEGIACYKDMMRAFLDITDNRKGGKIVAPANVVRRDSDDPYLVAAADKGTATFSDIANGLAAEYDFWLGDAFASGGSIGYDHKKMGITARGAWESVKRHFRELGLDTQAQDFDVIGVGDMAGDVFGNGMLLSEHIRLVGAFNHVHIVCDPDPNTAASFKERQRLFREVKGWDHYDLSKLSKGGRIYNRSDKSLTLTPEIMARFEIEREKVTPAELIQAMLRARTDLLWFGGIGTFIKAGSETHPDVGDKGNDSLRVNAAEIRARVIGEGANLGCTQRARIEYAMRGGRVNADFIDNSGGVNSSDLEVNIKILMTDLMAKKDSDMTRKKRDTLLTAMTDEVAALVLRNNYQQAQGISLMTMQSPQTLLRDTQLIRELERDQGLNRALENLPDDIEIENRRMAGQGLTRPELCVLQCYAKIADTRAILNSDIPEQAEIRDFLISYFPTPLRKKYVADIERHQLGREIIATAIANGIVNRMGATFIRAHMAATGVAHADVVRAFLIVRESLGLRDLWDRIEALDGKVDANAQLQAMLDIRATTNRAVRSILTRLGRAPDLGRDVPAFSDGVAAVRRGIDRALPANLSALVADRYDHTLRAGFGEVLARDLSHMAVLDSVLDAARIAMERKTKPVDTARIYFDVGAAFHLDWLRAGAENLPAADQWSQQARGGLIDQLYRAHSALVVAALRHAGARATPDQAVALWLGSKGADPLRQACAQLEAMQASGPVDLPRLMIAVQRLTDVA